MSFLDARIFFRFFPLMTGDVTGPCLCGGIDPEGGAGVTALEILYLKSVGISLSQTYQTGFTLIMGSMHIMTNKTGHLLVIQMYIVKTFKRVLLLHDPVFFMAQPASRVIIL